MKFHENENFFCTFEVLEWKQHKKTLLQRTIYQHAMNTKALTQFLSELREHNEKAWFDAHKKRYEVLRAEWLELIEAVIIGVAGFDSTVRNVEPKQCVFRINRDIRFSQDKSPYKTNFSMVIGSEGRKTLGPSYYMQIDASGEMFVAGGVWMPEKDHLAAIRNHIAEHPDRIEAVLANKTFKNMFGDIDRSESLTRLPKGFDDDVPHPDLIKLKSFIAQCPFKWKPSPDNALEQEIVRHFEAMYPFVEWLRQVEH